MSAGLSVVSGFSGVGASVTGYLGAQDSNVAGYAQTLANVALQRAEGLPVSAQQQTDETDSFGNLQNAVGRPTAVQIQQTVSDYARSYIAGTFSTSVNVEGLPTQTFVDPVYNYKDVVQTEEQDVPQNLDPNLQNTVVGLALETAPVSDMPATVHAEAMAHDADERLPTAAAGRITASPVASPSDQAAEIARLRRELDRTRMERDVLKNDRGSGPPVGGETARRHIAHGRERPFVFWWRRTPLKNMVHGLLRA